MYFPGDIITNYRFSNPEAENAHSHIIVNDEQGNEIYVVGKGDEDHLDPRVIKAMERQPPAKLYVLGRWKQDSSESKYFKATTDRGAACLNLKKLFYPSPFEYSAKHQQLMLHRMKDVAMLQNSNRIKFSKTKLFPPSGTLVPSSWQLAQMEDKWIMPVLLANRWSYDQEEGLALYPRYRVVFPEELKSNAACTCYKKVNCYFPYQFQGTYHDEEQSKKINLAFHGFLYPEYWHYKVWKHVFSDTPSQRQHQVHGFEEKEIWSGHIMNRSLHVPPKLFHQCKEYKDERCEPCDDETFNRVHHEIHVIAKQYIERFVTFFTFENTEKIVAVKKNYSNEVVHITIHCKRKEQYLGKNIYSYMELHGVSYDWDREQPIIHTHLVTYYVSSKNKIYSTGHACKLGKLSNLQKATI